MPKPHVVILGPSRDHAGANWPMALRLQMLKDLGRQRCPAVVMEKVPELEKENAARKFARIIRDWDVRTYLVIWPKGCRLNGLDIELGWILDELVAGRLDPKDVQLVTQVGHATVKEERGEGVWSMSEAGNRTRYYEALVDEGCILRKYETLADLRRNVNAAVLDHQQRHVLGVPEKEFVGKAAAQLRRRKPAKKGT